MPDGTTLPPTPAPTGVAASTTDAGGGCTRPLVERQVEALGELVGIGMKIARAIERQVDAVGAGPEAIAELNAAATAFARVARAVRQTVLLQNRLLEARTAAAARAGQLRARLNRIVRRAIEDEHDGDGQNEDGMGDAERVERLCAEAAEGLEQERWGDVLTRPVSVIVADICRDLGLDPDWRGLAGEIAAAEAFARGGKDDAAPDAGEDEPEYVDVCWIGDDGKPYPVARMRTTPNPGPHDPSRDPALRRDSS